MKRPWRLTLILTTLLSSCAASRNSQPELSKLLGENHRTQRPAILADGETWTGADIYVAAPTSMPALIDPRNATRNQRERGEVIRKGTPLEVHDIKLFKSDGHTTLTAFGTLVRNGIKTPFFADLGYSGVLNRAPWESYHVPQKRHFDLFYTKRVEQVGASNPLPAQ
ncbi:MAG: hypothetical protein AAF546_12600 [Verrucomicrobiota bacterium]